MKKFSSDFFRLLENINRIRETLIWLPLSADDTEESMFKEILDYIREYELNIQNPPSETIEKKGV